MRKNLQKILASKNITFYQSDRLSLDYYYHDSFQDQEMKIEPHAHFETEPIKSKKKIPLPPQPFSLFHYFLDGSRKPYKIGDMVTNDNKFVPLVVGQIKAGCCKRNCDREIKKHKLNNKYVFMLYEGISKSDFDSIKQAIEENTFNNIPVKVEKYRFSKNSDPDPTYSAISKIQDIMQQMEIDLLSEMVNSNDLDTDRMLIVDGSVKFIKHKFDRRIFYNVVGVSKSFNPNLTGLTPGKAHIGTLLTGLQFGERTPVFRMKTDRDISYGVWYMRIRDRHNVRNSLEGVIKVEKMATQDEIENGGLDTSTVDNISASILFERSPTCHGNDTRWANHLYPIYLTEKMIKTSFMSDRFFMNLF